MIGQILSLFSDLLSCSPLATGCAVLMLAVCVKMFYSLTCGGDRL